MNEICCAATKNGFGCTLDVGHRGHHEARDTNDKLCLSWPHDAPVEHREPTLPDPNLSPVDAAMLAMAVIRNHVAGDSGAFALNGLLEIIENSVGTLAAPDPRQERFRALLGDIYEALVDHYDGADIDEATASPHGWMADLMDRIQRSGAIP